MTKTFTIVGVVLTNKDLNIGYKLMAYAIAVCDTCSRRRAGKTRRLGAEYRQAEEYFYALIIATIPSCTVAFHDFAPNDTTH